MRSALKLATTVLVSEAAGIAGAVYAVNAIPLWYRMLSRPSFTPPDFLFGPVWIALYALMGISAFLIWRQGLGKKEVRDALGIYIVQLALNALWSVLFFGLENPALAFADIVVLWAAIAWTMRRFDRISRPAAWLLLPYLLWTSFALILNGAIWILN